MNHTFKLFVSGDTARARNARHALHELCERHLPGRYEIEVVDVLEAPDQAEEHRIIATPAIIKLRPPPPRRALGDLRDADRVVRALQIRLGRIESREETRP